jgi:uncharacterized protein (UPF0261 family)/ABC-type branched-subunit amino acid transport system ATPase component
MLEISQLDVHYGRAHALQGISLSLEKGVLAVVGRNGMGKTTLCNAITGLVRGISGSATAGSIKLAGEEILGLSPNVITGKGIGYVPQGRRVWPSLSVDEHLRLSSGNSSPRKNWNVERIYATFPRLAERKKNGGAELSGGEQQMLAISRALLFNPKLLVMDEPTEGLAPVIVQQVAAMLKTLAAEGEISVLLIEQNLGVAIEVADTIAVMVNGRIARSMPAAELAADRDLQQRLLGVKMEADVPQEEVLEEPSREIRVLTVKRASDAVVAGEPAREERTVRGFTRWGSANKDHVVNQEEEERAPEARVVEFPVAHSTERAAYIVGTFDTKGRELFYLRNCLDKLGLRTVTVDLATSGKPSPAQIHPREVARHHPKGERAVFTGDRGSAVTEMAVALEAFLAQRRDLGGMISAGGSGGTALATQGMRSLPIGVPKMMVSTVASGDVKPYVGPSDICMMYSVTDISGINRISEKVLANAAHSLAGMIAFGSTKKTTSESKPALGLTMFGLTTPCVQAVTKQLEAAYDCLVFHATGTGGQAMEKLAGSGLLAGVLDITTTEVTDEIAGGVLTAGPTRMDVFAKSKIPYVGSLGAVDMVNFWAYETVPSHLKSRNLYKHNSNVTLMRTTPEEAGRIGKFIVDKLNRMEGPVRFLIPEGGLSGLDKPGGAFWDPVANQALFKEIKSNFRTMKNKQLVSLPHHVNDQAFADALVANFNEIAAPWQELRARTS